MPKSFGKNVREKIVSHLIKSKLVIVGIPAIIKNSRGEILLGKREKNAVYYPSTWGLPGGLMDRGESIDKAIRRELKEELGVSSNVIKHGKIFNSLPTKECQIHSINIPVYCEIKGAPKSEDETSEVKWFKPEEIKKMKLAYRHKEILKEEGIIKWKK
ncbi:MAG: NUDIX hydrolase [Nanoarchaeota archaeon]|nr:NUDIX hydrolase [Nanoarchaeota archaeon]MBU1501519.1 NUDIX hydrolase [Nanoarchaeota archaeon]MBU2459445.1 NUDIX hydrolase [Nanoarchaeota archaeon]